MWDWKHHLMPNNNDDHLVNDGQSYKIRDFSKPKPRTPHKFSGLEAALSLYVHLILGAFCIVSCKTCFKLRKSINQREFKQNGWRVQLCLYISETGATFSPWEIERASDYPDMTEAHMDRLIMQVQQTPSPPSTAFFFLLPMQKKKKKEISCWSNHTEIVTQVCIML